MTRTVIITLAYTECHDQSGYTGIDMNHGTTRKVDGSHLLQETSAPYPVGHRKISDDNPKDGEKYITAELLSKTNVDGGLIGGASLVAEKFGAIIDAATKA